MRILSAIQALIAFAFIVVGLMALFGIGITGLLFLLPGAVFAATAGMIEENPRAGTVAALAADSVLAYFAGVKLEALLFAKAEIAFHQTAGVIDYLIPSATLVLIGIGAIAAVLDWRALRGSS